ncbi:MAG: LLM class flavin-dependent oxidoreductase [Anaerolineaceae bacterium]|nr:LLM class flavin-dependent oxidoreductase [Anaerolineaceae bacterium]MDE0330005.1 LLM class flavin-dependent oxidoreductase [Anaerolineaceae bacterium]
MRFSVRLNNDLPVEKTVSLALAAERAGFDQFWLSDDLFQRSATVMLAAVARETERIQIGSGIFNPYTLNPAQMAMEAATLDELSDGRFCMGLASGAGEFLKWIGIEQKKPLTAVVETIEVLRKLFAGEKAPLDGDFIQWSDATRLRFTPLRRQIPLYLGAMSPRMLQTIGSHADGGLPLLFPPEHFSWVLPQIRKGAHQAGRDLADIDVAACIWCSISEDSLAAENALRAKIAFYGHALSPTILARLGLTRGDFDDIEQAVVVENDLSRGSALVTGDMLRIGVVGTPRQLIRRLEDLVNLGARHLSFGPPLGPEPMKAIELIGNEVLPWFRGGSQ